MSKNVNYPILVRIDDICPTNDRKKFNLYREFFYQNDIKPIACIIPENRDPKLVKSNVNRDFWRFVRELKNDGWTIAMHGTHHLATGKVPGLVSGDVPTEFAGRTYDTQLKLLREGKHIMSKQGLDTEIFVAPNNSYDRNTILACKKLGLNYILGGLSTNSYKLDGVRFIPVARSWKKHRRGILVMCISTDNENLDGRETIFEFLRENRDRIITFEDALMQPMTNYYLARAQELIKLKWYEFIRKITNRFNREEEEE